MTTPALLRLRERFPAARIALLTPARLQDLWQHHPAVDEILAFAPGESLLAVARRLRAGRCDTALVLPNSPRSALEVWLARIPQRLGFARPWRTWFLTHAIPDRPGRVRLRKASAREIRRWISDPQVRARRPPPAEAHQLYEYLHLAGALGADTSPLAPWLAVAEAEIKAAVRKFNVPVVSPGSGPLLALNAGAEYGPAKRWPADRFIAAAREIHRRTRGPWLILGGPADTELAGEIASALAASGSAVRNLAGQTSLRELMALLRVARVLLTNDTGPMHVAAALGTPVVAIFGSTSPEMTGPGLPGDSRHCIVRVPTACAPCFRRTCPIDLRCLQGVSVDMVVAAVTAALKAPPPHQPAGSGSG